MLAVDSTPDDPSICGAGQSIAGPSALAVTQEKFLKRLPEPARHLLLIDTLDGDSAVVGSTNTSSTQEVSS